MRRRAYAQIRCPRPIRTVVPGSGTGTSEIGHLVTRITRPLQRIHHLKILPGSHLVVRRRHPSPGNAHIPCRTGLPGKRIRRNMLHPQAYRRLELPSESRIAATRHAIDQVEGNPGKAGLGQGLDRPNRLRAAMPTPHKGQSRIVERLHTYRKPVDPHRAPLPGFFFGNVFGVGLQGDLRLGRKGKTTGGPFEQESDVSRRKQRRRPSAEINSTQLAVFPAGRAKGKFSRHRLDHARAGTKVGYGKEIAIHAFAPAKRDMEIDTAHGNAALKKRGKGSPEGIFGYDEKIPGESARKGALSGLRPERRLRGACLGASRKRQPFIPASFSGNCSNPAP